MKLSIPTLTPGKVIRIPAALPPVVKGRMVITPTASQLVQLSNGENYWTPSETNGEGTLSVAPYKVPTEIPAWKGRTILRLTPTSDGTLWDDVQSAIAGLPDQQRVAFEEVLGGTIWTRNSPMLITLAQDDAINLTSQQVDMLFVAANNIQG
jgi:hypothetical protein